MLCAIIKGTNDTQRERTPREMSREAIFLGFHKKKDTFAKSYPKWPVARVISHLISFMSYHLKTTSSPQCVQIFVSDAQWPFHTVRLSQTSDSGATIALHKNGIANIFWYSFRTIQRLYVRWTHSRVCRPQRAFFLKQERPPVQILVQTARPFSVKKMAYKGTANLHKP